ncbi:MAG: thermonuclease family protein [Candidatus Omnitrophica bacterium]|nr:thermonuclease family protein [Candidatus Omnitrophota bacterium]
MTKLPAQDSYPRLLHRIKTEIDSGRRKIEHTRALTYWNVGKDINEDILKNKQRSGYGEYLYDRLAGDLGMCYRSVERVVQFYRQFQMPTRASALSWSHYVELLNVSNKIQRRELQKRADKEGLNRDELRAEIAQWRQADAARRTVTITANKPPAAKLTARKGILYTCKVDAVENGALDLDLGFDVTRRYRPRGGLKESAAGTIVQVVKKSGAFLMGPSGRTAEDLYYYKAEVKKVIDGDTLWARIGLGFNTFVRQKLRLRGIDAPELKTAEGQKAKRFVEQALEGLEFILVRTSTSDKYDRYLVDIFYGPEETFLNQRLLDEGLAEVWKD